MEIFITVSEGLVMLSKLLFSIVVLVGLSILIAPPIPATDLFVGQFGPVLAKPHFVIDDYHYIEDVPVRFVTSRQINYMGWYFALSKLSGNGNDNAGLGWSTGFWFWRADYWLNWELPSNGISLDPMYSKLTGFYWEIGPVFYVRHHHFVLRPSITIAPDFEFYNLSIDNSEESGHSMHILARLDLQAQIPIKGSLSITLGYRRGLLHHTSTYEVENGVRLTGKFHHPEEFYVGLAIVREQ